MWRWVKRWWAKKPEQLVTITDANGNAIDPNQGIEYLVNARDTLDEMINKAKPNSVVKKKDEWPEVIE